MKKTLQNAIEILKAGTCVPASEWTSGSGKNTSRRAIPEHCDIIETSKIKSTYTGGEKKGDYIVSMPNDARLRLANAAAARPKVRKWIYIHDMNALLESLKA